MRKLIVLTCLGFLLPGIASAGHRYHQDDLLTAAKRLDRAARALYENLHYQSGYGPATDRAKSFSRSASRFCDYVSYRGRGRHVQEAYGRLARRFERLSYEVHHVNRYVSRDFSRVARAFSSVGRSLDIRRSYSRNRYNRNYRYDRRPRSRYYLSWYR